MTSPHDRALDLVEAGELLGTGPDHIRDLITARQLPAERVDHALQVLESALIQYLTSPPPLSNSATPTEGRASA